MRANLAARRALPARLTAAGRASANCRYIVTFIIHRCAFRYFVLCRRHPPSQFPQGAWIAHLRQRCRGTLHRPRGETVDAMIDQLVQKDSEIVSFSDSFILISSKNIKLPFKPNISMSLNFIALN